MQRRDFVILATGAAVALGLGVGVGLWRLAPSEPTVTPHAIYSAKFTDLAGKHQDLRQWQGQVMVLNFWATWCPPCREEIPDFIKFDQKYRGKGVAVIGIALDERDKVSEFAKEFAIAYPLLMGSAETYDFTEKLGNKVKGLPFTAIIDRQGNVAFLGLGAIRHKELEKAALPLLQ